MRRSSVAMLGLLTLVSAATRRMDTPAAIAWDRDSVRLVAEGGFYPRLIKLESDSLLATFSRGDSVWTSRSEDGGRTWKDSVRVGGFERGHSTNSEIAQLADGRILCTFNERDTRNAKTRGSPVPDNGIAIAFSDDGGATWSKPRRIYGGGPVWEPVAVEVGNELCILFADETPFPTSHEQQISRMVSRDGGKSWSAPEAVSFRAGHRDGMPVPAKLADGRLVMAIEDNGLSGNFKPAIIDFSGKDSLPVGGESRDRWGALAEPLAAEVYAGAPYLVRLGDHATVLSAQVDEKGDEKHRRMAVWVGNAGARHFAGRSMPFESLSPKDEQLWNALLAVGDDRVLAITGTRVNGKIGVWTIEGRLAR